MESRIMQVFYGNDCLPYKDSARSVHYPIVGNSFIGASNTTQIRFYVRDIGGVNNVSWVAISKLPNGKIGSQVLSGIHLDSELNEYYVALYLSSYYTQLKGDVYISLNGYQGGVQVEEDEDTGIYTIVGTPIIEATGSIKLAINYAPQLPLGQHFNISDIQQMLGLISEKANIVNTVQVVADISQEDLSGYDDGQLFYDISTQSYYEKDLSVESPYYVLADKIGLLGSQHTLPRYVVQPLDFIAELEEKVGQDIFFVFSIDEEKEYFAKFIDTGSTYGELFAFTFDENSNLTLLRYAIDGNLDDFGDFSEYATETEYVQMTDNPSVVYATTDESQQTTIVYGYGIESETIVQRDGNGQINVPNTPTTNSHATSKKYVDAKIAALGTVFDYKGSKTVAELNALTGQVAGQVYNVTDSGTLSAGNVVVTAGDNVVWNGSTWDRMTGDYVPTSRTIVGISLVSNITPTQLTNNLVYADNGDIDSLF